MAFGDEPVPGLDSPYRVAKKILLDWAYGTGAADHTFWDYPERTMPAPGPHFDFGETYHGYRVSPQYHGEETPYGGTPRAWRPPISRLVDYLAGGVGRNPAMSDVSQTEWRYPEGLEDSVFRHMIVPKDVQVPGYYPPVGPVLRDLQKATIRPGLRYPRGANPDAWPPGSPALDWMDSRRDPDAREWTDDPARSGKQAPVTLGVTAPMVDRGKGVVAQRPIRINPGASLAAALGAMYHEGVHSQGYDENVAYPQGYRADLQMLRDLDPARYPPGYAQLYGNANVRNDIATYLGSSAPIDLLHHYAPGDERTPRMIQDARNRGDLKPRPDPYATTTRSDVWKWLGDQLKGGGW